MPPIITEALYRVAQEALHNVARHARATRVDVQLSCSEERVTLTIEDNGVGFDTGRTRKGLGISSMQERLISNGGRLTVESHPGTGTTVRAEIDISPRSADDPMKQARPTTPDDQRAKREAVASGRAPRTTAANRLGTPQTKIGTRVQPETPRPEAWAWLGERLVIPVGQVWPWLPVDQTHYLREPVLQHETHVLKRERRVLGLRRTYALLTSDGSGTLVRIAPERTGYKWDLAGADWELRRVRGLKGRAVLERSGQPLAAMQYRGRQMDTWTEIIYDDRSYRLIYGDSGSEDFLLLDAGGSTILVASHVLQTTSTSQDSGTSRQPGTQVTLSRPLPLPLVTIAIARILDEAQMKEVTDAG